MCCVKDCVVNFTEHIEDEVKRLYATFPQQPITELTDVLKREHRTAENVTSVLKEFNNLENKNYYVCSTLCNCERSLCAFLYRFSHIKLFDNNYK